jgi:hypothetical protein
LVSSILIYTTKTFFENTIHNRSAHSYFAITLNLRAYSGIKKEGRPLIILRHKQQFRGQSAVLGIRKLFLTIAVRAFCLAIFVSLVVEDSLKKPPWIITFMLNALFIHRHLLPLPENRNEFSFRVSQCSNGRTYSLHETV